MTGFAFIMNGAKHRAETLLEASHLFASIRDAADLTMHNCPDVMLMDCSDEDLHVPFGRFSYNARIWPLGDYEPGMTPLFCPYDVRHDVAIPSHWTELPEEEDGSDPQTDETPLQAFGLGCADHEEGDSLIIIIPANTTVLVFEKGVEEVAEYVFDSWVELLLFSGDWQRDQVDRAIVRHVAGSSLH